VSALGTSKAASVGGLFRSPGDQRRFCARAHGARTEAPRPVAGELVEVSQLCEQPLHRGCWLRNERLETDPAHTMNASWALSKAAPARGWWRRGCSERNRARWRRSISNRACMAALRCSLLLSAVEQCEILCADGASQKRTRHWRRVPVKGGRAKDCLAWPAHGLAARRCGRDLGEALRSRSSMPDSKGRHRNELNLV
jgi:hypothetical protein